jgi:hypothetical protein
MSVDDYQALFTEAYDERLAIIHGAERTEAGLVLTIDGAKVVSGFAGALPALGCCLHRLIVFVRQHGPGQPGDVIVCSEKCGALAGTLRFADGVWSKTR